MGETVEEMLQASVRSQNAASVMASSREARDVFWASRMDDEVTVMLRPSVRVTCE